MGEARSTILISLTVTLSFFSCSFTATSQPNEQLRSPSPYETVNNFCLHKRLNVAKPFCLRVLKNPKASNVKPNDLNPLLQVAINSTSSFICRTLNHLLGLFEDLTTKPSLIPAIDQCLTAYEDVAVYITNVLEDASQESTIAGLDGEVIEGYINECIKASARTRDDDIAEWNYEAKNYAKLLIDIADSLTSNETK